MRYKVGDILTIRSNLEIDDVNVVYEMIKFKGKKVNIISIGFGAYRIAEDDGEWAWFDDMFEEPKVQIKNNSPYFYTVSKWDDLEEFRNDRYKISVGDTRIYVYELKSPKSTSYVDIEEDKNLISKWLKQFGFEVELKKKPTLTAKEMVIVKGLIALDFYYLTNLGGYIYAKNNNQPDLFISITMFKFMSNTEAFSLAYLVLLEVSDV